MRMRTTNSNNSWIKSKINELENKNLIIEEINEIKYSLKNLIKR